MPYKTNDFIQVDDKFGNASKIDEFSTILTIQGNKSLIIPNSKMTKEIVTNYSNEGSVRLNVEVQIIEQQLLKYMKKSK
jgi:small conductance mechanosensitive channel